MVSPYVTHLANKLYTTLTNFLSRGSFLALPDLQGAVGNGLAITLAVMLDALRAKAAKAWSHLKPPRGWTRLSKGNYALN